MKKNLKIFGANLEWATAHLYCKKKKIVLQPSEKWVELYCNLREKCVAIHYFVLQRRGLCCIVGLYCRRLGCREIVSKYKKKKKKKLYCD